jgi:hypothetical protein
LKAIIDSQRARVGAAMKKTLFALPAAAALAALALAGCQS